MKHALINKDNKVVNIIIWDGQSWLPPVDHMVIRCDDCNIGDTYDKASHTFTKE